MSQASDAIVADEYEFDYSPDQTISAEQRIEILEAQLAELSERVDSILALLYDGRSLSNSGSPWD